jgi:hypothetical protein
MELRASSVAGSSGTPRDVPEHQCGAAEDDLQTRARHVAMRSAALSSSSATDRRVIQRSVTFSGSDNRPSCGSCGTRCCPCRRCVHRRWSQNQRSKPPIRPELQISYCPPRGSRQQSTIAAQAQGAARTREVLPGCRTAAGRNAHW